MKSIDIFLHSVDDVKKFVDIANKIDGNITLLSGRYIVDAKSIMGIFSLDLTKPLRLEIEDWKDEYALIFEDYLVE